MCALTVHGNLPGKSFVLLEAEEELCRAFPVALTQLLLFLLFCGRQRFSGAVKIKKRRRNSRLSKSIFHELRALQRKLPWSDSF